MSAPPKTPLPDGLARTPEAWSEVVASWGEPGYRAKQIFGWLHARAVLDPARMTNLGKALRARVAEELGPLPEVEHVHQAADDTKKLLLRLADGSQVETVLLPVDKPAGKLDADAAAADDEDDDEPKSRGTRVTQCISTQVGCAMGCVFCASGIAGLTRHMTASEILTQVLLAKAQLAEGESLHHVVFMGMGEPLHNYEATATTLRLLTHPEGLGLSPRRLTVSTSGLVPEIDRLGQEFGGHVGLAISLHNASDARRSALMPINDRYPLASLMAALHRYPLPRGRRITIEYTLVRGQNDSPADAHALAERLAGLRVKINLIPMNPIAHSELGPPEPAEVEAFQQILRDRGYLCFVRRRRGDDVSAACGQLVMLGKEPNRRFRERQPKPEGGQP
ncbi:MAG: 23S rRNA (adenine(2503)-C(2))-methyltransferase RlmN [Myxococcales bacterium]|nr:23S rRNA (adenine(2503)-C(2))-methyltransferase RlmN [Myxococcales bacterium]